MAGSKVRTYMYLGLVAGELQVSFEALCFEIFEGMGEIDVDSRL